MITVVTDTAQQRKSREAQIKNDFDLIPPGIPEEFTVGNKTIQNPKMMP